MKKKLENPEPDLILSHISDGLVMLDLEGRVQYSNAVFDEIAGQPVLKGKKLSGLFDPETGQKIDPRKFPLQEGEQIHFNLEIPGKDGSVGAYCFSASLVKDENGNPVGVLENFRDMNRLRSMILQLQEVNQVIQREKDKTEKIIGSIADGIFTVDRDLRIVSFSGMMEKLTGIASGEAIGRKCSEVLRGTKCETDCPLKWSFANGSPVERCREVLRMNGKHVTVSMTTAFLNDEQPGLIGIVQDHSEEERLRQQLHEKYSYHTIVGRSSGMQQVFQIIESVATRDTTVLIQGETGTGKELVAQAIHYSSPRRDGPFVMLNCAALNDNLLESELFGHVRGAFTGAVADRPGRFELAAGGTLFLDEIGDTTPALQSKLLRAIEEKSFERVGDTRTRKVDVRIIAATNRDLTKLVSEGKFREDLYFRLAVMPIRIPPLRARREDMPLLVQHFIEKYKKRYLGANAEQFEGISNRALALLLRYNWPGNVRELEHAIEHAIISTNTGRIERQFLPDAIRALEPLNEPPPEDSSTNALEDSLQRNLEAHRWNVSRTAEALGVSRTTLWRRMKKADLR